MNVELGCESKGNHDSGRWAPRKTRDGKLEIWGGCGGGGDVGGRGVQLYVKEGDREGNVRVWLFAYPQFNAAVQTFCSKSFCNQCLMLVANIWAQLYICVCFYVCDCVFVFCPWYLRCFVYLFVCVFMFVNVCLFFARWYLRCLCCAGGSPHAQISLVWPQYPIQLLFSNNCEQCGNVLSQWIDKLNAEISCAWSPNQSDLTSIPN